MSPLYPLRRLKPDGEATEIRCKAYFKIRHSQLGLRNKSWLKHLSIDTYEGRTESHEQLFLHANCGQQTKESAVVDGTSCCVILECLVTSVARIT